MSQRAASVFVIAALFMTSCSTSHTRTPPSPPHTCIAGSFFTLSQLYDYCAPGPSPTVGAASSLPKGPEANPPCPPFAKGGTSGQQSCIQGAPSSLATDPQLASAARPKGRSYRDAPSFGECNSALACEGKTVFVKGLVDYDNVVEHRAYPQLPYEKFFLNDLDRHSLEIVAVSLDNVALFDKIFSAKENGRKEVLVKGTIRGIDEPIMGACRRGIRLETRSADSIRFK